MHIMGSAKKWGPNNGAKQTRIVGQEVAKMSTFLSVNQGHKLNSDSSKQKSIFSLAEITPTNIGAGTMATGFSNRLNAVIENSVQ